MKKEKSKTIKYIVIGSFLLIAILVLLGIYMEYDHNEVNRELKKDGYTTKTKEDAFYKKIITSNTLDEYYNDVANHKNSEYEEYYLSKDSYDYIEVKLNYKNGKSTSLNIQSNLKSSEIKYNYEITDSKINLILEGTNQTSCQAIIKEGIEESAIQEYCRNIQKEMDIYKDRKSEILQNEKVQEILTE